MKKYLFIALAALGFAACEKSADDNNVQQNGELEQSYVAITLAADDMTRADDGKYEEGLNEERAVHEAIVFFFKNGAPFYVKHDGDTSTNDGRYNYLKIKLEDNDPASNMPNISDIKDEVLVLENYKGQYPNQMLAILNWSPEKASYSLSELQTLISDLGNDAKGYVMSNSVYADAAKTVVDAVKITEANISKDETGALANPVNIYVERIAAKVSFSAKDNGVFAIGEQVSNAEGGDNVMGDAPVDVYARIEGFQLYNDFEDSHLIKGIDATWSDLGFTWNDPDFHRSYWAKSQTKEFPNNTFDWNNNYTALNAAKPFVYCGENTQADKHTKVIIKATLVKKVGDNYEPLEVVNWFGQNYIGEEQLKTVVANTLKYTYFSSADEGKTFSGITPGDLKCVARGGNEKAYEVYIQLSDDASAKTWYKFDELKSEYKKYSDNAVLNDELKADVQPALVYNDGMTYYYTDIRHLGNGKGMAGDYGVVRNHVYKVNITDIQGFGTPVYDPEIDFVTPETPEDMTTFVSAQVNILSWRVVAEDYEIGGEY